jgi:hypothetical protein
MSATGGAKQRDELASRDVERDVGQHARAVIGDGHVFDGEIGRHVEHGRFYSRNALTGESACIPQQ